MAQQVTIDIVADTKKLASGVDETNKQLGGLKTGIDKTQQAAVGLASAFILKEGISFAKKAAEEFIDAEKTGKAAAKVFGEGSAALQKITDDASKFADELAVDNDEIIKLATGLGVRLPKDAQASSAELVLLAKNLEAASAGTISAEAVVSKLGKAFSDGEVTAKELSKTVPGLDDATYQLAETLSKAGDNQGAMNALVEAGQKKFGDAAADQVTGAQRMEKAMGDLYEMIGEYVVPVVEKLTEFIKDAIEWIIKNKDVIVPLVTVLGTFAAGILILNAGLTAYNAIMAAWKVATTIATVAQTLFNAVMLANPIGLVIAAIVAIIAIIVLLVKNWDTVTEVVGKVWNAIKNFASDAWKVLKDFGKKVVDFVGDIIGAYLKIPKAMLEIGKDIVYGLWNGIKSVMNWLKEKIENSFIGTIIGKVNDLFGRKSPSKVFAEIGKDLVRGLAIGIDTSKNLALDAVGQLAFSTVGSITTPQLAAGQGRQVAPVTVNINAGLGTDPYELGRVVNSALKKYNSISGGI